MLKQQLQEAYANRFAYVPDYAPVLKFDPAQPRDDQGQWTKTTGRSFTSEEGYQWHEQGPGATWAKTKLTAEDARVLGNYAGFGYHRINDLRRGIYKTPIIDHFVRAATPAEMKRIGWDLEKNDWVPSIAVEGGYKPGYEIDPRDKMTPEGIKRFGYRMGKSDASDYDPEDPYHSVEDGRIIVNQFYRPVEDGPTMMFSIRKPGPDLKTLHNLQLEADALDDAIANRGLVLTEPIEVIRGAYLPGVTFEQLQDMAYSDQEWEEKGFTSTMLGDAGGRARSYPALGKWESISHRFGTASGTLLLHQNEEGEAVQFHITLPAGTKVASVEAARRVNHTFPKVVVPVPERLKDNEWFKEHPETYTEHDYTATPTLDTADLEDKDRRSESEILLGSGARFRVTKVLPGYTYMTQDELKPVKVREVHLEYIGGGSSDGRQRS